MDNLHPNWVGLIKRVESIAPREGQCRAIVTIHVLFDEGVPVLWGRPKTVPLEPKNSDSLDILLEAFVGE